MDSISCNTFLTSLGRHLKIRLAMKKHFRVSIDRERCKGCELCIPVCPRHLLIMTTALNRKGYHVSEAAHAEECLGCLKCAQMCPEAAIEILNVP